MTKETLEKGRELLKKREELYALYDRINAMPEIKYVLFRFTPGSEEFSSNHLSGLEEFIESVSDKLLSEIDELEKQFEKL